MTPGLSVPDLGGSFNTELGKLAQSAANEPSPSPAYYPSVDALLVTDTLGVIDDANPEMCQMLGHSRETLIGTPFKQYFTHAGQAEDGIRQVVAEERIYDLVLSLRSAIGSAAVVSFNAATYRDSEGKLEGIRVSGREVSAQIRLQDELREAQQYTRGLIEASFDALLTIDPQLRIIDINEQTARITGFSREELIGSFFPDYFSDPKLAGAGVAKALADGLINDYVLELGSKTGQRTLVSFNASVYKDTEGTVRGIFAAGRDITEQTRLEEELRQAQNYTRGLIEASIDPIFTVDADLTITDVNEQMVRLTEICKQELVGSRFDTLFTEPDRAASGVRETLRESSVTNYGLTLRKPNGREVPVSFNASIFRDAAGKVRGIFAVARDVTEQRQLEHDLQEQQNYTRGLIEAVVDALITVDPQGRITDVNEQMVRLTGHNKKNLLGNAFADFFSDPDRARAGIKETLETGVIKNYELVIKTKKGGLAPVSFNASVFRDTGGRVAKIFASARDTSDQKRLEEKLRESENYNRGLIESSVDALLTVDPSLFITDVNDQMVRLTGYSRDDLVGSLFRDYFTEPARATAGVRQTFDEGSVTNYELVLKSVTGKRTLVSFNAGTFKDTSGRVAGIMAAARDITAQKRLEEQLRDQQNYSRSLIESRVDALMTVDPEGIITDINEQAVKLTGYTRRQLEGSAFTNYFTDPESAMTSVRRTFDEGFVTNYELVVRSKSGRRISVSFNAAVFHDIKGEVAGILAVARDNSEQKQIEQDMRELQVYTRGLIESNIDALMTTDTLGIITDVNKQMCAVTGCTQEQLVGTPFKQYFTDPKRAENAIRQVLAEDRVTNYELTLRAQEGRELRVSYNATTFRGADGKLRGVFAAARDITEQKLLQQQLQRKNLQLEEQNRRVQEATRLKSEFLANMSHELRTPLNGIIGFSELMHDGKVGPVSADHKEYLGDILTSSRHLQQLINDVLDLAKVESGKMDFRPERVDLGRLVGEVRDVLRTLTAKKRIHMVSEVAPELGEIVIDPAKLKQVLYNYLSNAIKFTPEKGRVSIRACLPESTAQ